MLVRPQKTSNPPSLPTNLELTLVGHLAASRLVRLSSEEEIAYQREEQLDGFSVVLLESKRAALVPLQGPGW